MQNADYQSFQRRDKSLTEDEVKRKFVPFLKDFYRNRYEPLPNTVSVELDNVSEEGYIADGKMSFRKSDGTPFVCTYEATSRDKAEEVKYAVNMRYFRWDAAAFSTLFTAGAYTIFYGLKRVWLIDLHWTGNIGLLIGLFMIGFFAWYFTMRNWKKYRFIYALEQFKQYQVDEQWIALADDVFPSPVDPYLVELRNQCVYHGFGLAIVPAEGEVRRLRDPSRLRIYGKDRKIAHWLTRTDWFQSVAQNMAPGARPPGPPGPLKVVWNKVSRPVNYFLVGPYKRFAAERINQTVGQTTLAATRFMSGQRIQKWICLLGLLVILPLSYRVLSFRDYEVADLETLKAKKNYENPEDDNGYVMDGQAPPISGVTKQYPVTARRTREPDSTTARTAADEVPTFEFSGGDDDTEETAAAPVKKAVAKPKPKPKPKPVDPCAALQGKRGWIIQESAYTAKANADTHAAALKAKEITAEVVSRKCIDKGQDGYFIRVGTIHTDGADARKQAASLTKALTKAGFKKVKLIVREL